MTLSPARAVLHGTRNRSLVVCSALAAALVAVIAATMVIGDYPLTILEVLDTLTGGGSDRDRYIVFNVRLPRLLMAIACGVGLAVSGAIMQSLLRNPLASPELLGISGGASVAAVAGTLIFGLTGFALVGAAFFGGSVIAGILLIAASRQGASSYRIVLAGVGIAFVCIAIVGFIIKRAQLNRAQDALRWITGSIDATPWRDVWVLLAVLAVATPLVFAASRILPQLELGEQRAAGLGVAVGSARTWILVTAVFLAASVTAFIGPVAFVALSAPAIARGMVGRGSAVIAASALVGAVIMPLSDLAAQYALGKSVPVGIVTGMVGAVYLLWLLARPKGQRT
ncbi:iron ABC transporter permease [uncultured Agrococcus sp.]|uniref:FecCD family ABC transporter permease n=1 Tax=uncultured Agrococcus sp. TaxID=382258 RepID=UPI002600F962|nr:iron ABC transporter permease [uncultured Agrococcus sp.]